MADAERGSEPVSAMDSPQPVSQAPSQAAAAEKAVVEDCAAVKVPGRRALPAADARGSGVDDDSSLAI